MPIKRFIVFLFLFALALPRPAGAVYATGTELAQRCENGAHKGAYFCLGYVAGIIDYHLLLQSFGTAPTVAICLPDGVSVERAAFVVLSYLKSQPQNGSFVAAPAVVMALGQHYPCKPKLPPKRKKK
jgi:Rap1a immunity proteins